MSNLANVLRSAFRGGDIEWWEEEEEIMEDEGSGAKSDFYGEYSDDEDGFSNYGDMSDDGSGDYTISDDEDVIIVPDWTKQSEFEKLDEKWDPWPTSTTSTTTTTSRPSSGTSSVHLKNKLELIRAVITYILPVATCYLGGFLTETPWIFQ